MAGNWFSPFTGDKIQVTQLVGRSLLGFDVSPLFFCPSTCFPAGGNVLSCVGGRALLVEVAF